MATLQDSRAPLEEKPWTMKPCRVDRFSGSDHQYLINMKADMCSWGNPSRLPCCPHKHNGNPQSHCGAVFNVTWIRSFIHSFILRFIPSTNLHHYVSGATLGAGSLAEEKTNSCHEGVDSRPLVSMGLGPKPPNLKSLYKMVRGWGVAL